MDSIKRLWKKYGKNRLHLITILKELQEEKGFVAEEEIQKLAEGLGCPWPKLKVLSPSTIF